MCRFRAITAFLFVVGGICLACNYRNAPPKNPTEEGTAIINLSAVTNSSQTEVFREVRQASRLPSAVLDKLGGGSGPGSTIQLYLYSRPEIAYGGTCRGGCF